MFEELFTAGLRMPPHPVLGYIVKVLCASLSAPNATGQLSKYIWMVVSFRGVPSVDGFTKRYELHYQP
jgi:hypothetical protein